MVRIKHRYLLLNFLYPDAKSKQSIGSPQSDGDVPWIVQFRQPSSDLIDARLLTRIIRDRVTELFGDYGAGMISNSLQVKYLSTATSVAIVRVARSQYRLVVRVSGTIKKAEEEAIRRARSVILLARRSTPTSLLDTAGRAIMNSEGKCQIATDDVDLQMDDLVQNPVDLSDSDESADG